MTNLSQFKAKATVGRILNCIYHMKFKERDAAGKIIYQDEPRPPRPISIVQTNAIAMKQDQGNGVFTDSWFHFPPAKDCEFTADGKMIVYETDERTNQRHKLLTYWFD